MASGDKRTHASLVSQTSGAYATYGVETSSRALHPAKMLVFLSRCSNPDAVFAIPAGTKRHRHSLTARRAAWRRNERRRRSQRRRRASARQSAGRRSKYSPLPVFDFERVVDCVTRAGASRRAVSALRRTSAPPVPVGRQRASARQGLELHSIRQCRKVKMGANSFAPRQRQQTAPLVLGSGLSPTPSCVSHAARQRLRSSNHIGRHSGARPSGREPGIQ